MFSIVSVAPILYEIYQERVTLQEESMAISLCHNLLLEWQVTGGLPAATVVFPSKDGKSFDASWEQDSGVMKICLDWTGSNGREKSVCGEAR